MPNWVQLKDGVAFAYVNSSGIVENSIMLEDSIDPESIMAKKYQDGEWVDAPLIYFVEEMLGNKVLRTNSTVFASDVTGDIIGPDVKAMWTKTESGEFIPPANIGEATIYDEHLFQ
ncbi:MAG: hypothetical protein RLZZ196_45 [Bacteroidota bacterium]|jgi:hypothetical protein